MKKYIFILFFFAFIIIFSQSYIEEKYIDSIYKQYGELKIISFYPKSKTLLENPINEFIITFNKPVFSLKKIENINIRYNSEPNIEGVFRVKSNNTIVFIPFNALEYSRSYKFTIKKGLMAIDSSVLIKDMSFIIPRLKLQILHFNLYSKKLHPDSSIYITLNYKIPEEELKNSIKITNLKTNKNIVFKVSLLKQSIIEKGFTYKITPLHIHKITLSSDFKFYFFNKKYMISPFRSYFSSINYFKYLSGNINIFSLPYYGKTSIRIVFSNPINLIDMQKYIKLYDNDTLINTNINYPYKSIEDFYLTADLKPNKVYKLYIMDSIIDIYNNRIENPGYYRIKTGNYYSFLELKQDYIYAPKPIVSVYTLNKDSFDIYAKFMNVNEFIKYMETYNMKKNFPFIRYSIQHETNKPIMNSIDLGKYFKNNGFLGMGYVQHYSEYQDTITLPFVFQISDIEAHIVFSQKNGFIIVNDAYKPYNLLFSKLLIYNSKGNIAGRFSAKNGIFEINKKNIKMFVSDNNHYESMYITAMTSKSNVFLKYIKDNYPERINAFLIPERDLYTYSDTVRIIGIIREDKLNTMKYIEKKFLDYTIYNPNYKIIKYGKIKIENNGSFIITMPINDTMKTGNYSCRLKNYGYTSFRIEEFKKPYFEVNIKAEKDLYKYNENPIFYLSGDYLNGMSMSNDSFYIEYYLNKTVFHSKKYNDFSFHITNDTFHIKSPYYVEKGVLDKNGKSKTVLKINPNIKNPVNIKTVLTIKGIDKSAISKNYNVEKITNKFYGGIKLSIDNNKEQLLLKWLIIDNNDSIVENKKARILLLRSKDFRLTKCDTLLNKVYISKSAIDTIIEKYDNEYHYKAVLIFNNNEIISRTYRKSFEHYEYTPYIISDKSSYSISDTAIIKIIPYKNEKQLIFFYGNDSIFDYSIIDINADTIIKKIKIEEYMLPGFYIKTFSLGRDSLSDYNMKSLYINVNNEIKEIKATVTTDKKEYAPQDTITININTEEKHCYAIVSIIDKSVLMLSNYNWANPLNIFYGNVSDNIKYYNSYKIRHYSYRYKALGEGITGSPDISLSLDKETEKSNTMANTPELPQNITIRKDFRRTVYFNSNIEIKNGYKQIKFIIPDNLTEYKINVILFTEDKFSQISNTFKVNKKLMINSSMPSFLRPFDKIDLSFVAMDNTNVKGNITGIIDKTNIKLKNNKDILTPKYNKCEFKFFANIPLIDTLKLNLLISKDSFYDRMSINIPVITRELFEYAAFFNNTEDSSREYVEIDTTIIKDISSIDITLRPSIIAGMQLPLNYLYNYQYMCLEQQLSKVLPFIIGEKLIEEYSLSKLKGRKLRRFVYSILKKVIDYQDNNGGFKYYTDSKFANEYLSIYTMYVLKRAQENNYKVNKRMIERGIKFLKQIVENNFIEQWEYKKITRNSLIAEAIYVLTLYNVFDYKDILLGIFNNRDYMYISSKSRLLLALNSYNLNNEKDILLGEIISNIKMESEYAYFDDGQRSYWTFQNEVKNTAQVLYAIFKLNAPFEFSPQIIMFFNKRLKIGWINTHTTAIVLDALYEYYKKYENRNTDFNYTVKLNKQTKTYSKFKSVNDKDTLSIKGKDMILGNNIIDLIKKGTGRLYYTIRLKYALKKQKELFNGFDIKKSILTLDNKPVIEFKRGEIYKIQIDIKTDKSRTFVIIDDPLPAGFNIIKKGFVTEYINIINNNTKYSWYGFTHEEYYKDKCIASAIYLPTGKTQYTYYVRAIASGVFNMPETNVFEMYNPEVFSHTASSIITIK